jgi:CheY-like chemotaxis protein/anti-sigma regulatory factor (Ser/Thr protein kinase)
MPTSILVVDDSQIQRVLVEGLLSKNPDYDVRLAADGCEALEAIARDKPDLVVTDLVMPEMDGLELVRTVRRRFPEIPVILMTAYGDESIAVDAMEAGAASYVPKAQKAERLMAAVERVAEHAAANRSREQVKQCMFEYHCRFALENDRRLIRALVAQIQEAMAGVGFGDAVERIRVSEALEEALLNAMYHGNLEISQAELAQLRAELDDHMLDRMVEDRCRDSHLGERRILLVAHLKENEARFVVRDEGRGFNTMSLVNAPNKDTFASGAHRGMILIGTLMDQVTFNQAGNELVMLKRVAVQGRDEPGRIKMPFAG